MNVLSLFDGMSCGQIAFKQLGITVEEYYACEIDKHAIRVSQAKWPGMKHLGSVVDVHAKDLPKIDIIIGGSPCQGFSSSGKGLNFEDPRSKLFFEFVRLYHECREINPNVLFMLENVRMKKEWEDIISRILEIQPININSARVSAQNRERLYWTNIAMKKRGLFDDNYCSIPQPEDKGIYVRNILEDEIDSKYLLSEKSIKHIMRNKHAKNYEALFSEIDMPVCVAMRGRNIENPNDITPGNDVEQRLEPNYSGKTNTITSVEKDNYVVHNLMPISSKTGKGGSGLLSRSNGKTYCLDTGNTNAIEFVKNKVIRRFTPVELCRLQTVPDGYFKHIGGGYICSERQIVKMCGNGWTVDVIVHIFSYAKF